MSAYTQNQNKGGDYMKLADYINSLGMDVRAEEEEDGTITIYFDNVEQDYFIEGIKTSDDIYDYWEGFDIEEEVYNWLQAKKYGVKGVPYVTELVEEEQLIEDTLHDLAMKTINFKEV